MADKSLKPIDLVSLSNAPSTPGSGFVRVYGKTDGKVYAKNDSGTEFDLTESTAFTINAQTGTSYTLVLADAGKMVRCSNAAAITLTVPTNASVAFPIGTYLLIEQQGAGTVTVTPAGGVTINNTARKTPMQNTTVMLYKVGTDTWNVTGGTV
jgi:hypothetical protein